MVWLCCHFGFGYSKKMSHFQTCRLWVLGWLSKARYCAFVLIMRLHIYRSLCVHKAQFLTSQIAISLPSWNQTHQREKKNSIKILSTTRYLSWARFSGELDCVPGIGGKPLHYVVICTISRQGSSWFRRQQSLFRRRHPTNADWALFKSKKDNFPIRNRQVSKQAAGMITLSKSYRRSSTLASSRPGYLALRPGKKAMRRIVRFPSAVVRSLVLCSKRSSWPIWVRWRTPTTEKSDSMKSSRHYFRCVRVSSFEKKIKLSIK